MRLRPWDFPGNRSSSGRAHGIPTMYFTPRTCNSPEGISCEILQRPRQAASRQRREARCKHRGGGGRGFWDAARPYHKLDLICVHLDENTPAHSLAIRRRYARSTKPQKSLSPQATSTHATHTKVVLPIRPQTTATSSRSERKQRIPVEFCSTAKREADFRASC